jgi:hypothetical protein
VLFLQTAPNKIIMLSVAMLNVITLNVILLSVVAPSCLKSLFVVIATLKSVCHKVAFSAKDYILEYIHKMSNKLLLLYNFFVMFSHNNLEAS